MALSVLASTKPATVIDGRTCRHGKLHPQPQPPPRLGNFIRLYRNFPKFNDQAAVAVNSPLRQCPLLLDQTLIERPPISHPSSCPLSPSPLRLAEADDENVSGCVSAFAPKDAWNDTSTDEDSPGRHGTPFATTSSRDTTPASSPVTPGEPELCPKSLTPIQQLLVGSTIDCIDIANPEDTYEQQIRTIRTAQIYQEKILQSLVNPSITRPKVSTPEGHLLRLQRKERIAVAELAATHLRSPFAEPFSVTWDLNGDFYPGCEQFTSSNSPWALQSKPGYPYMKPLSKHWIEPLYRVNPEAQLNILKAKADLRFVEDALMRELSQIPQAKQPIHVFVDLSNIIIGYYDCMKAKRGVQNNYRVQAPPFFFQAFALMLERHRPCAKRVVVGSLKPATNHADYMKAAEQCGYKLNILQRVSSPNKPKTPKNSHLAQFPASGALDDETDDYGPWCPPMKVAMKHREQGVDEILHLKMVQSILDAPKPGTMVLATGDAAEAEFSDGFLSNVVRALERGWNVELVGWKRNISSAWRSTTFQDKWAMGQFRLIELDDVAEELLGYCLPQPGRGGPVLKSGQ